MARNRQRARERKERLRRENVPGELEHASAEVDEAEASIVAGAEGEEVDASDEELAEQAEAAAPAADERDGSNGRAAAVSAAATLDREAEAIAPTRGRGGARFLQFLRACWAELQRVQWPDRRQVGQATAVVLGFVVIAGAFLGLADVVAEELVDLIL